MHAQRSSVARPRDPVLDALDRAPIGEPFPPDVLATLDQTMADITAGRVQLVSHEDVPAWLEQQACSESRG